MIHSNSNSFTHSFIHPSNDSFSQSQIHSFIHSFIKTQIHPFIPSHFHHSFHNFITPSIPLTSRHFRKSASILILRNQLPQLRPILKQKRNRRRTAAPHSLRPSRPLPAIHSLHSIRPLRPIGFLRSLASIAFLNAFKSLQSLQSLLRRRILRKRLRRQDPGRFVPPRLRVSLGVRRVRSIGVQPTLGRFIRFGLQLSHSILEGFRQTHNTAGILQVFRA